MVAPWHLSCSHRHVRIPLFNSNKEYSSRTDHITLVSSLLLFIIFPPIYSLIAYTIIFLPSLVGCGWCLFLHLYQNHVELRPIRRTPRKTTGKMILMFALPFFSENDWAEVTTMKKVNLVEGRYVIKTSIQVLFL